MKVAVIGAGESGLTSIKCCLDEELEPVCFEKTNDIGGLWNYIPEVEDGRASIYESVVTNTSKEMMCYSDFPIPEGYPNFLHNTKMMEYYKQYAERFSLLKYIQFNTLVCSVKKHPNFSRTGQWEVTTEKDGKKETSIFDAVMVCNGHHTDPYYPLESFPGLNKFKGQYFHSREYKSTKGFEGKRVLVVGMGNTGTDIAVELSRTASQVYLSTRRGCWVMSRVFDQGYPCDICFDTRFQTLLRNTLPTPIVTWLTEKKMNEWFDHAHYGLQPRDSTQFKEPLFNDELPSRIICGYVIVKPNLTEFTETSVKFNDGTIEENIDVVVFATGYRYSFPFLDESILKVENKIFLYKSVFPKNLEKATLGVVGLIQPLGPIMAASEMQARWITRVFKGLCKFPSQDEIQKDIELKQKILLTRFGKEYSLQLDYIEYLDEIAQEIGCKPNILGLLVTDPFLALKVVFGPCTPAQYRLRGPGQWPMARKQIMTTFDRILKPTKTRVVRTHKEKRSMVYGLCALCILALLLALAMYKN
ncbi:dimethylaniline monooxygenase [N-oxide-forming] 2-like isoform X1 [Aquarana catesbeiana]|uniref:dimethylaniline monooxygenase [N-oxide-forming] 2-like isoform X1 n=2 Tax=Aquarana catesbeiana TaxID=8400 RepID=UPI003CC9FB67